MGSVLHLAQGLEADLRVFLPHLYKSPLEKLSIMVAGVIEARSCNLMEIAARLPLETERVESRYAWIERFLSAKTIDDMDVMDVLADAAVADAASSGQTVVVSLDQTSVNNTQAVAMLSLRVGERALPLFWTVKACQGNLPVKTYLPLVARLAGLLPFGASVLLLADRFFGTPELIAACQKYGFAYRIRLKGNLTLTQQGGDCRVDDIPKLCPAGAIDVALANSKVCTNVGYLHEKGHPEAWFIAMNAMPSRTTVLDYGLRWSIETMFADYKTRGFGLEDTHIQREDRLSRLLLVLAIALYWATANGRAVQKKHPQKAV
jgi:hypothetical protein